MVRRASRSTTRPARSCRGRQTEVANHCWLTGLEPDTEYTYKVFVKGQEWASGERWDWSAKESALVQSGGTYDNRFRTNPDATRPASSLAFAVIGDFGVGVRKDTPTRRQQQVAHALRRMVDSEGVRFRPHDRRQHLRARARLRRRGRRHRRRRRRLVLHLLSAVSLRDQPHSRVSVDRQSRRG